MGARRRARIRWRMVAVLAATLIMTFVLQIGIMGEKVYKPEAVVEYRDGEVVIKINNEERIERNIEEEEIYQEIEERLGMQALRLGYKPSGMELYKVEILEKAGEAKVHYLYNEQTLTIYMSRDFSNADINIKLDGDGKSLDTAEIFDLNMDVDIVEVTGKKEEILYFTQFDLNNSSFLLKGTIEKETFFEIIKGIYIKNA